MLDTNYSVDILVNDKPIRKIPHNGKLFIESRDGQEYSIRIKNNSLSRILAVTSIDGLDVLNGKPASENGNGYVINGYNSLNLDGFRVSDEKVARFVFSKKDDSYAASKGDGSEKNVGVIGIRIFQEKIKPAPVIKEIHHHHDHYYPTYPHYPRRWPYYDWYYGDPPYYTTTTCGDNTFNTCGNNTLLNTGNMTGGITFNGLTGGLTAKGLSNSTRNTTVTNLSYSSLNCSSESSRGFDMGTQWGVAKESNVIEVEFEKGILALTSNIYYASRESLIEMGVPIESKKQVSFPEPFNEKYATPPKNWNG